MTMKYAMAGAAGALFLASAPAMAGTKDDVRDLQARMQRAEQALSAASASSVRVSELEAQLQDLTGRIEELTFRLDQQDRRLDAIAAALSGGEIGDASGGLVGSVVDGEPGFGSGPVDLTGGAGPAPDADGVTYADELPVAPAGDFGADIALPLDGDAAFDYASGFLLNGDYQRAKAAFDLYAQTFPNHPRTPDAKFRLGEIHLALRENAEAADVFLKHIEQYPQDPRGAEAYLKLGTAIARLDQADQACNIFKTMRSKYPGAPAALMSRADIEMARIDCR